MPAASPRVLRVTLPVLSLLSAFLLFQVQPLISKFILPWFGGSPGVWTTCMLFFQVLLFAGYAYAHVLTRFPQRVQWIIHSALLLAAVAMLPITPDPAWKPSGNEDPTWRILGLLGRHVALPYFMLATTSPLVQVWFSRAYETGNPWRLYALSNLGSFVALLSYPFFFEPRWDVLSQAGGWSWAFGLFALVSASCAWIDGQSAAQHAAAAELAVPSAAPQWWRRTLWVILPALASVFLIAATNHVCQDVAVIPFLWVVPLSLYLITFILCFEFERLYHPLWWGLIAMAFFVAAAVQMGFEGDDYDHSETLKSVVGFFVGYNEHGLLNRDPSDVLRDDFRAQLFACLGAMFFGCMVCHGQLARLKPAAGRLTEFYLLMSAGGAIGGLFVNLVAPQIFTTYLEWQLVLMACFVVAGGAVFAWIVSVTDWQHRQLFCSLAGFVVLGTLVLGINYASFWELEPPPRIERVRNFYGAISVDETPYEDEGGSLREFYYGSILHGTQWTMDPWRTQPFSYYNHEAGVGRTLLTLKLRTDAKVGVLGMGTATIAAYGGFGHTYRFYEINPAVVKIAQNNFTYLKDFVGRGGNLEIVMGDGRLNLEREPSQQFDALALDAFAGDSVPVHLLTREAFEIYRRHMKPDGIIIVHVSNRYLELYPMVEKLAKSMGYKSTRIVHEADDGYELTDYVLVTNNEAFLKANPREEEDRYVTKMKDEDVPIWTDVDHNLLSVLDTD